MSNPFSKYVRDPSTIPDPNKMTLEQFQKYNSYEMNKLGSFFRSVRKSGLYMAGVVGLCWIYTAYRVGETKHELFGSDYKGGSYLDLHTWRDEAHYAYNREFQRTFHLAEAKVKDAPKNSDKLLTDLGVHLPAQYASGVPKRSAHEKYF